MSAVRGVALQVSQVLVDMTKYRYFAFRRLADELAIPFSIEDGDRMPEGDVLHSVEALLGLGGLDISAKDKTELKLRAEGYLRDYLETASPADVETGAPEFLRGLRAAGIPSLALAGTPEDVRVLERTGLGPLFDAVLAPEDGLGRVCREDDFRLAAERLEIPHEDCAAMVGTGPCASAARAAGLAVVGVGERDPFEEAHLRVPGLWAMPPDVRDLRVREDGR